MDTVTLTDFKSLGNYRLLQDATSTDNLPFDTLNCDEELWKGEMLTSQNGIYTATINPNSNFILN